MADIFGSDTIEAEDTNESITVDTLVGDDRKYRNVDDLARAYANADAFIERTKAERAEEQAELKVLRDIAEARKTRDKQASDEPTAEDRPKQPDPTNEPKDVDVRELVRQELKDTQEQTRRAANINEAAQAMTKTFGSPAKAQEAIRRRAEELGVGFEWLRDVAADSPKAFLSSMGVDPTARSSTTPSYSPETIRGSSSNGGVRNFAYFEKMRKESPKVYFSGDVQKQMFAARRELGDKFYSN